MQLDAKIEARQWILIAIQNYSVTPAKETEREVRRFVRRIQRDLKQLRGARGAKHKGIAIRLGGA